MKRKWAIRLSAAAAATLLLAFIGAELFLRLHYGLCDAVLMRADDDYEYIAQPSQDRRRFGNRVLYNSLSMRSEELREGSVRLLFLGDSILNGGTLTDHEHLATTLLSRRLGSDLRRDVQVLNVSAGSWGPDNCFAWLKRHGDFGARAIVLVVSSHDAHDTMTFVPVVGRLKYYPTRQYPLAVLELWDRYLFPSSSVFHQTKADADAQFRREHHIERTSVPFNPGFQALAEYAREKSIPFAVYLHASAGELAAQSYDADGKAIRTFAESRGLPLVQDLGSGLSMECYRTNDGLHYGDAGQSLMAELLYPFCLKAAQGK